MEIGTNEWLELRKRCITASDIPVILGLIKDKTPIKLWEQKLGLREPDEQNDAMRHGLESEDKARKKLSEFTGITFKPAIVFHEKHPHFMATLDGLDFSETKACEIKCPYYRASFDSLRKSGEPKERDYAQMQWQMYVKGLENVIYFPYWSDDEWIIQECNRSDEYIKFIEDEAKKFYECLQTKTPPKDKYVRPEGDEIAEIENQIVKYRRLAKEYDEKYKAAKTALLEFSDYQPIIAGRVRIDVQECRGNIDYKSIPELDGVNFEQYRRSSYLKYVCNIEEGDE
ncbi:MAG: YqaJ viral recombinase family protein [Candidatus Bathyarchaeota archaeon]|jgi:putative phage-type endonuclease